MEEAAIALVIMLGLLGFIGGLIWIISKSDEPSGLQAKVTRLEADNADLKSLRALVEDIYVRADEGRQVADPGLSVIADMVESRTRIRRPAR